MKVNAEADRSNNRRNVFQHPSLWESTEYIVHFQFIYSTVSPVSLFLHSKYSVWPFLIETPTPIETGLSISPVFILQSSAFNQTNTTNNTATNLCHLLQFILQYTQNMDTNYAIF